MSLKKNIEAQLELLKAFIYFKNHKKASNLAFKVLPVNKF